MRKFFYWFGALAAALTLLLIVGFCYLFYTSSRLDRESKDYADAASLAITSHWNPHELLSRASPNLRSSMTIKQASSVFEWFGVLGTPIQSQDCKGSAMLFASFGKPSSITAQYVCSTNYQQGAATIDIALVKMDERWMVSGFYVKSPALLARKPMQQL